MHELWSSASYDAHLWSLPFAFAPAAMTVVIAYGIVMRGDPVLRAWMLVHFVTLLPYSICMALSPSVTSPVAAEQWFRIGSSFIPLTAAAGLGFQMRLLRIRTRLVEVGIVVALAWLITDALTNAAVGGVYWLPAGMWYANAGPLAWLTMITVGALSTPGFVLMIWRARTDRPSVERRQLRAFLLAAVVTNGGMADTLLAWHLGVFPLGWLLSGIGSILAIRAMILEDSLRARAIDNTAPRVLLHLVIALVFGWVTLDQLGPGLRWWADALAMAGVFAAVRVTIAVFDLITRAGRTTENTLDRLANQLASRARTARDEPEVARLAIEVILLGTGVRTDIVTAAAEDYGWTTATGQRLDDATAPDPLLGAWLAEHPGPVYAETPDVPEDLRPLLANALAYARASALVPVISRDELLALILVPAIPRRLRGRAYAFVERAAERLGGGLVHVRLAHRAAARAALAREIELAATVQGQLLPGRGPHVHGDVTVVGSWQPATRCAGDFWAFHPLGPDRLLLAIGDVTGHGVAAATVTAAAAGACEAAVRRHGDELELGALVTALDLAVARVGGGQLAMTLFAAIIDRGARTIRYVSCGHTAPYVVHAASEGPIELHALVGRGNPLGGGSTGAPRAQQRPLRAGDLLVWYTDGVIDAQDPHGEPFGDRRLQRLLRRLDIAALAPPAVHDIVHASVVAHRAGRPRADDETLVVAQWLPPSSP